MDRTDGRSGEIRVFGIRKKPSGEVVTFSLVEGRKKLPDGIIRCVRDVIDESEAARQASHMMNTEEMEKPDDPTAESPVDEPEFVEGVVAECVDRGKSHLCIVLRIFEDSVMALFFTSKTTWGRKRRRATQEELAVAGFISTKRTYVVSVLRHSSSFVPTSRSATSLLLEDLQREFRREDADVWRGDVTPEGIEPSLLT